METSDTIARISSAEQNECLSLVCFVFVFRVFVHLSPLVLAEVRVWYFCSV